MLRTLVLALVCVFVAAPPALAKKRHAAAHGRAHAAHAAKKSKRQKALVRMQKTAPPTRVASVERRVEPTLPEVATTRATAAPVAPVAPVARPAIAAAEPTPEPAPPVAHGPVGPQASDDEVPGSRMKR
jgi:hypothetical protein